MNVVVKKEIDHAVWLEQQIEELQRECSAQDLSLAIRKEVERRLGVCKELLSGVVAGQASADQLACSLKEIALLIKENRISNR